jgi:hypothetical protein
MRLLLQVNSTNWAGREEDEAGNGELEREEQSAGQLVYYSFVQWWKRT